jgi:hypothetical protein
MNFPIVASGKPFDLLDDAALRPVLPVKKRGNNREPQLNAAFEPLECRMPGRFSGTTSGERECQAEARGKR